MATERSTCEVISCNYLGPQTPVEGKRGGARREREREKERERDGEGRGRDTFTTIVIQIGLLKVSKLN